MVFLEVEEMRRKMGEKMRRRKGGDDIRTFTRSPFTTTTNEDETIATPNGGLLTTPTCFHPSMASFPVSTCGWLAPQARTFAARC